MIPKSTIEVLYMEDIKVNRHYVTIPLTWRKDRRGADLEWDTLASLDLSELSEIPKGARVFIEYRVDEMLDGLVISWDES
jgi:hypothetical protein